MTEIESPVNKYIDVYINNYVRQFRNFITSNYIVNIGGVAGFIAADDHDLSFLLRKLQTYGFEVIISNGQDTIDEIQVEYTIRGNTNDELFEYRIENLVSTIYLSSKTGISIVGILVMQIISEIICKSKILYKAVILDLDDTIWKGTLAEDGIDAIKQNLRSNDAIPFIGFMRFIQALAKELGLYIAICSRNNNEKVLSAIDRLDENEFPLKGQIDCIVANYNDKSKNIKAIAQKLSILTSACVFIDDNKIVRDEVRQNLPEVFVPDWDNHDELLTLLLTCGAFDRFELSLKSRNRKRLYAVLQQEREKSYLPRLLVKVSDDINHVEAMRLYAKSNQFKFSEKKEYYEKSRSLIFEIYRGNGENLGVCSAVTYAENKQNIHVLNWAISCRYFEIGLEEYILMYIFALANNRTITFAFDDTGFNGKAIELIEKYKDIFIENDKNGNICFVPNRQSINDMQLNTNLKEYCNE
ncbi:MULTISPECIES: HAD-IIIC family phosphatase [Bacteroidaceae]|uniref:HAD-IIIC family phosphatase n=1 Tax=Bacteroidaceae TaxID=815 RepID=UPI0030C4E95B